MRKVSNFVLTVVGWCLFTVGLLSDVLVVKFVCLAIARGLPPAVSLTVRCEWRNLADEVIYDHVESGR
jgi:hypothetical protein